MFSDLPKLLTKEFAIAYFLPSAAFTAISHFMLTYFVISHDFLLFDAKPSDIVSFTFFSSLCGIILLSINRIIIRFFEGYWPFGLDYRLNGIQVRRFRRLTKKIKDLDILRERCKADGVDLEPKLKKMRIDLKIKLVESFPHDENCILPTAFGNTYRAFEIYSAVMYGADSIPSWYRLLSVVPSSYQELMNSSKAYVDFWVNFCFLCTLTSIEFYILYLMSTVVKTASTMHLIPILSILAAYICYLFAIRATARWGDWVKAAFDIYLPDLRNKLGFIPPKNIDDEKKEWNNFSRAVIYRMPSALPKRIPKEGQP